MGGPAGVSWMAAHDLECTIEMILEGREGRGEEGVERGEGDGRKEKREGSKRRKREGTWRSIFH